MSEQKGVFVLMGLFLLFCRCPVCFLVSRLDSFVFVSLFDFFVIIALFDSFNVIARLDRAIQQFIFWHLRLFFLSSAAFLSVIIRLDRIIHAAEYHFLCPLLSRPPGEA